MEIKSLTSLRGIAAWYVVVYHFREAIPGPIPHAVSNLLGMGYLAVDLFFVLSGFVLFLGYGHQLSSLSLPNIIDFYGKRLARIYPLHVFILLLYLANPLAIVLMSQQAALGDRYSWVYYLQSWFLVQNWGFSDSVAWNVPAWSISVELFAYLLCPFFIPLVVNFGRFHVGFPLVLGAVCLFSLAGIYKISGLSSIGQDIAGLGVFRCLLGFSSGVIVGWYYCHSFSWLRFGGWFYWGLVVIFLGLMSSFGVFDFALAPVICVFLVALLAVDRSIFSRLLAGSVFHYLGRISYSTYLVHYFVRDWVKFLENSFGWGDFIAYIAIVLGASHVLYHLIEVPFRSKFFNFWTLHTLQRMKNA